MRRAAAAFLCCLLAACNDQIPTTIASAAGSPAMLISDASHGGGNDHFYFLPPLVRPTSYAGTFDPDLSPMVTICEWSGTSCVGDPLATFSNAAGEGSELVRMEPGEQQYVVNWHTSRYNIDETKTYRIKVSIGAYELGFADVQPYVSRAEAKNINTGEFIALKDGTTLPIKFRVEVGAVPEIARNAIDAGRYYHNCALDVTGAAYCWGRGDYGQLGNRNVENSMVPVAVHGGYSFVSISVGEIHSCALTAEGIAYCWGYNGAGAVGIDFRYAYETTPVPVAGGHVFVQLKAGARHTCGLTGSGSVYCWGWNFNSVIGGGSTELNVYSPVPVTGANTFKSLYAGSAHNCAIAASGAAYCWGNNGGGALGTGAATGSQSTPTAVNGGFSFASMALGSSTSCALTVNGTAYCWGSNWAGQLGRGTITPFGQSEPENFAPGEVIGGLAFASLHGGGGHMCGITNSGRGYCWGANYDAQLGTGLATPSGLATPQLIAGDLLWSELALGTEHTCGITVLGVAKCWGDNGQGQLGDGTRTASATFKDVVGALTFATP